MLGDSRTVRLWVDGRDVVERLDDGWNEFVQEQRIGSLAPTAPGTSFWASVEGGAAAALYEVMFERARERYSVTVDLWAASSERRAKVELVVVPHGVRGGIELSLRMVFEIARPPLALFDDDVVRDREDLVVCDFCQKVMAFDWCEAETAVRQLRIDQDGPQPRLKPSVCDPCERMVYASSGALRL